LGIGGAVLAVRSSGDDTTDRLVGRFLVDRTRVAANVQPVCIEFHARPADLPRVRRVLSVRRKRSAWSRTRIRGAPPGTVTAMSLDAQLDALLRLVLAALAGGILGLERETQDKPAGVRTFAVVAIGACLFTLVGELAFDGKDDPVSRLVAQIVTGIGFLGAGTIIQVKDRVEGLTTAAGIWSAAAIGMAFGFGLYLLGIGTTALLLIAFAVIGRLLPGKVRSDG
jgi:putative Mg2+ transporter-C (MgtC) family protein